MAVMEPESTRAHLPVRCPPEAAISADWPARVAIVGLGLMGGSLALAIRRRQPDVEVIGIDRDPDALQLARRSGAVDAGTTSLRGGVRGADLVVLAATVSAIVELLPALPSLISEKTLVTDLGSTKAEICHVAQDVLPAQFVGGHPFVGSEQRGIEAAHSDLLRGAPYALTPLPDGGEQAERLARFLRSLNVRVTILGPAEHDRVAAATSHLPQLLAVALASWVHDKVEVDRRYRELVGGGLLDMTRIASSPFAVWTDVFSSNREKLDRALGEYIEELIRHREQLRHGDMSEAFEKAQRLRR